MEPLPAHIVLVQAEAERLIQYLETLPPTALHHPSACAGWEVGDVMAHLTRGTDAYVTWITRGLNGETAPLPGTPPAGTREDATSAARRAQRARDIRIQLGECLLATLQESTIRFNALLSGLSPDNWAKLCYHPTRLRPVSDFVALRLGELVLHGWDIRSTLETRAPLTAECLPLCLELLPDMADWAFHPGKPLPVAIRCRLLEQDDTPHLYDLVSTGDQARLVLAGEEPAQLVCHCDATTLLLLMSGRLALSVARTTGHLRLDGEPQLYNTLTQWFPGT